MVVRSVFIKQLRRPSVVGQVDFTERMLRQVREVEERRILARVFWQERIALAGSIAVGAGAIVAVMVFPGRIGAFLRRIGASFAERGAAWADRIPQTIGVVVSEWQLYAVLGVLLGFAICCFVDLLAGDKLRMA